MTKPICVLAFSGGLDTSFCVALLSESYDVVTVTVDTGGVTALEGEYLEARARQLGAVKHVLIDGRQLFFDKIIKYLIRGNVLRGGTYPLSVGAERTIQAMEVCRIARQEGAKAIAHGSTGAGNDQLRFDIAFAVLAPEIERLAPIRQHSISRAKATEYLRNKGVPIEEKKSKYSINTGLWGTTIGGSETHNEWSEVPNEAFPNTISPLLAPDTPEEITIEFENGIPKRCNALEGAGQAVVEYVADVGARHGVGRGVHIGTTTLGVKGRLAFEAPAPIILITSHRELEKLVLTREQLHVSSVLSNVYCQAIHEGRYFEPAMRDIEAFWDSGQSSVSGEVRARLFKGNCEIVGCRSPYSLLNRGAIYGEETKNYLGRDAEGFCVVQSLELNAVFARNQEMRLSPSLRNTLAGPQ
jgi:argininosuccinate synthase